MKKIMFVALSFIGLMYSPVVSHASASESNIKLISGVTSEDVASMSDTEFDEFLVGFIADNKKRDISMDVIESNLNELGVELGEVQSTESNNRYIGMSKVTLDVYSSKRAGESFYRLIASPSFHAHDYSAGGYDAISIEWDPSKAAYYSSSVGSNAYKSDGSGRLNGLYLFNVKDSAMWNGSYTYVSVYVTPKKTNTWLDFGSKYTHTYDDLKANISIGTNANFTQSGFGAGLSYVVNASTVQDFWNMYNDNAVYLK